MHQVVLRLCAQILGAWSCKTTTMLADPDNKASLAEGAIRLQLPLAVDYRNCPPESSGARYELVSNMQRALSTLCGIDHYRLLMRDLTPPSTPLANLSQHGLDPEGIGAYATFDVLPATGGEPSPESTARSLQLMLDDPTGTSPFYHEEAAATTARREAYQFFQLYPPVRGATLTQLAEDGTFSARIPPPSPPPPSYPPSPSPPPPRKPPSPPSRSPACDSSRGGSEKGCGGEVISTADEGGEMPAAYIGGGVALVVALCVCACFLLLRRRAQRAQEQKLTAAVNQGDTQKKLAQVQVAMRGGGMM